MPCLATYVPTEFAAARANALLPPAFATATTAAVFTEPFMTPCSTPLVTAPPAPGNTMLRATPATAATACP